MNVEDPVVTQTFYDIPVVITNEETVTSKGYQYIIESGEMIDIKVEGKRSIVDNLQESDLSAVADFSTISNMNLVDIDATCPKYAEDELIVSAKTNAMSIKLEDSETQSFNIHVVLEGDVKEGYSAFETSSSTLVQVTGAQSQVAKVKEVAVYIDVEGKKDSFSVEAVPVAIDMDGNAIDANKISLSANTVDVDVEILPVKDVTVAVLGRGKPAYGYRIANIDFAPSTVKIAGAADNLSRIEKLYVSVDVADATESIEQNFELATILEDTYKGLFKPAQDDVTIATVVTIEKLSSQVVDAAMSDIEVKNLEEGLRCDLSAQTSVKIKALGTPEQLDGLTASELELYVDCTGCKAGTYNLEIKSSYEGELVIESVTTNFVVRDAG